MTDEERVEEYLDRVETTVWDSEGNRIDICGKLEIAYLAGLREGRSEARASMYTKLQELRNQIEKLESDLEELKAHCRAVDDVNAKMKNCTNCVIWKECESSYRTE